MTFTNNTSKIKNRQRADVVWSILYFIAVPFPSSKPCSTSQVCNNASTAAFLQRYISETPLYGSAEEFPTDVCLSNGEAESKVYSIHEEKVFRVTYGLLGSLFGIF